MKHKQGSGVVYVTDSKDRDQVTINWKTPTPKDWKCKYCHFNVLHFHFDENDNIKK